MPSISKFIIIYVCVCVCVCLTCIIYSLLQVVYINYYSSLLVKNESYLYIEVGFTYLNFSK